MFKGTPAKPTIFHCGTAGGGAGADTAGDSNQFFRSMIRNIKGLGLGRSNYNTGAQVLSTDYMTTRAGGGVAPGHETAFKNKLATHYDKQLVIENVNMWGCIFGFRTGTQWEFYLQENATISYRKVEDIVRHFVAEAIAQRRPGSASTFPLSRRSSSHCRNPADPPRPAGRRHPSLPGGAAVANVTSRWKTLRDMTPTLRSSRRLPFGTRRP